MTLSYQRKLYFSGKVTVTHWQLFSVKRNSLQELSYEWYFSGKYQENNTFGQIKLNSSTNSKYTDIFLDIQSVRLYVYPRD